MSEPISIEINGGEVEERQYLSVFIEKSLNEVGFSDVQNSVYVEKEINEEKIVTLYDYAINKNPDLFTQPIEITTQEDSSPIDQEDSVDVNSTVEEELEY